MKQMTPFSRILAAVALGALGAIGAIALAGAYAETHRVPDQP
jgi:hypothetical protein